MASDAGIGGSRLFQRVIGILDAPLRGIKSRKAFVAKQEELLRDDPGYGYAYSVFLRLAEVYHGCEFLRYSAVLLSGYRARAKAGKPLVPRSEYIRYHIESHKINAVGLYDRSLLLINAVFQLGNPERACRDETVLENGYVADHAVVSTMRVLRKFLDDCRQERNIVVHRRRYDDEELARLAVFSHATLDGELARWTPFARTQHDHYAMEQKRRITTFNEHVFPLLVDVVDSLCGRFDLTYKSLRGGCQ